MQKKLTAINSRISKASFLGLLFFVSLSLLSFANTQTAHAVTGDYNKAATGTLAATEWNNLINDFVATSGSRLDGYFSINTATSSAYALDVLGTIRATNFTGAYTGTLSAANVSAGAFGLNTGGGNYNFLGNVGVGIGTSTPGSLLTIANNRWISALNNAGTSYINMFKVNANDELEIGGALNIGQFQFAEDSGYNTFVDMPVSATPVAGTIEGYVMKVDGDNILSVYSESNGTGGIQNRRIGINTSTPAFTLDVNGIVNATGLYLNGSPYIGSQWTTLGSNIYYNTGNVGLGTTTPVSTLDVNGLIKMRTALITANEDVVNKGYLDSALASSTASIITQVATSSFWQGAMNGNVYSVNTGNIGVGVTNPTTKFQVAGGSTWLKPNETGASGTALSLGRQSDANVPLVDIITDDSPGDAIDFVLHRWTSTFNFKRDYSAGLGNVMSLVSHYTNGTYLSLFNNDAAGNTTTIKLNTNGASFLMGGNVGIGTTNPGYALDIGGTGILNVGGSMIRFGTTKIIGTTGNNVQINSKASGSDVQIVNYNTGSANVTFKDNGNVGISTSTPNAKLAVNDGNIFINDAAITSGTPKAAITKEYLDSSLTAFNTENNLWRLNGTNIYASSTSWDLGIGITNPGAKLAVVGADDKDSGPIISLSGLGANQTESGRLRFTEVDIQASPYYQGAFIHYDGAANALNIGVHNNGDSNTANDTNVITIARPTGNTSIGGTALNVLYGGNVGVGTSTPATALSVSGGNVFVNDAAITSGTPKAAVTKEYLDSSLSTFNTENSLWKLNGSNLYASSTSWNLGIGTTTPSEKLDIEGTVVGGTAMRLYNNNAGYGDRGIIKFNGNTAGGGNSNTAMAQIVGGHTSAGNVNYLDFKVGAWNNNNTVGSTLVRITGAGNVGIGTTTPNEKLTILSVPGDILSLSGGSITTRFIFNTSWNATVGDFLSLRNSQVSAANAQFVLGGNGKVGIGTTTPNSAQLVIATSTSNYTLDAGNFRIGNVAAPVQNLDAVNKSYMDSALSAATSSISTLWGGTTGGNVWSLNSGNVGIGTTTPGQKLDVSGNINISTNGDNTLISNYKGPNSDGYNVFIGGGGQLVTGAVGESWKGAYNSALGYKALENLTTGWSNMAIGSYALNLNSTGTDNIAIGPNALQNNTASSNSGVGSYALWKNTTGNNNAAQGAAALSYNTIGNLNTAQGSQTLMKNTTGNNNTAQGAYALWTNTTGNSNTAQGYAALFYNSSGTQNAAQGRVALYSNTTGSNNAAQGDSALYYNTTGHSNSAQGFGALTNNTTGYQNVASGFEAGRFTSTGAGNQTGNNSLFLGYNTKPLGNGETNEIVIGASAVGIGSNSVVLGNDSILKTILKGNVGIGTTTPNSAQLVIATSTSNYTLDAGNYRVGNVAAPVQNLDAVNKSYLDSAILAATSSITFWGGNVGGNVYSLNSGNIGIGTTNPETALQIGVGSGTTASSSILTIRGNTNDDVNIPKIRLRESTNGGESGFDISYYGLNNRFAITSNDGFGAINERFSIDRGTGNVGIGTTNPGALLHVGSTFPTIRYTQIDSSGQLIANFNNNGNSAPISMRNLDTTAAIAHSVTLQSYFGRTGDGTAREGGYLRFGKEQEWTSTVSTNDSYISLGVMNNYSYNDALRVSATGNIGVGITNPSAKVYIVKDGPYNSEGTLGLAITTDNTGTYDTKLGMGVSSGGYGFIQTQTYNGWSTKPLLLQAAGGIVGIGTTTPNAALTVNGGNIFINDSAITSGTPKAAITKEYLDSSLTAFNTESNLWKLNSSNVYASSTAWNLGVGTTNPSTKFEIAESSVLRYQIGGGQTTSYISGASENAVQRVNLKNANVNGLGGMWQFYTNYDTVADFFGKFGYKFQGGTTDTYKQFQIYIADSANPKMVVAGSGNVGIGTAAPNGKLDIRDANNAAIYFSSNAADPTSSVSKIYSGYGGSGGWPNTYLRFATQPVSGSYNDAMTILGSGNVGIGTTTPAASLSVSGGNIFINDAVITSATPNAAITKTYLDAALLSATSSINTLWGGTTTGNIWSLASGNVGVGTTSPGAKLDVVGTVKARSYFSYDANGYGGASFSSSYNYANGEGLIRAAGATYPTVFSPNGGVIIGPQSGNPPANGLLVGGNVGLGGITSPNSRLHVYATSTNSEIDIQSVVGAGNHWGMYSNLSDNSFRIWGGSDYMTFLRGGNVGIGTTNPGAKLDIQTTATQLRLYNDIATATQDAGGIIDFGGRWSTGSSLLTWAQVKGLKSDASSGSIAGYLSFITNSGAGNDLQERMRITNLGNVGINTTNPGAYRLNVNGDTNITGSLNVTGTTTATAFIGPLSGTINAANVSSGAFGANTGNGNYSFAGNVGINSTNPSSQLDIISNKGISGGLSLRVLVNSATNQGYFGVDGTGAGGAADKIYFGGRGDSNDGFVGSRVNLHFDTNYQRRLTILQNGNIGIGTTDPGIYRLKVSGDVAITGTLQTQTGSDFAEEFSVSEDIPAGMVVVMADDGHKSVKAADKKYDRTVVGIVSDNPSIIAGKVDSDKKVVVAMMGVVSVNVSNRNGGISKGDLLTSSDLSGYAMKASDFRPGTVIGKALEDLSGNSGKIKVLVNLQ